MSEELSQIIRRCAKQDMYDDNGYCEHKIKKSEAYFMRITRDGNGDTHCAECMLQMVIHDKERNFTYQDDWFAEHKMFTGCERLIRKQNNL